MVNLHTSKIGNRVNTFSTLIKVLKTKKEWMIEVTYNISYTGSYDQAALFAFKYS